MRTQMISEKQVTGDSGEEIILTYELLVEELRDQEDNFLCELYGAQITRRSETLVETKRMQSITALGDEILRLVEELARYTVFPVHMEECVQALLP